MTALAVFSSDLSRARISFVLAASKRFAMRCMRLLGFRAHGNSSVFHSLVPGVHVEAPAIGRASAGAGVVEDVGVETAWIVVSVGTVDHAPMRQIAFSQGLARECREDGKPSFRAGLVAQFGDYAVLHPPFPAFRRGGLEPEVPPVFWIVLRFPRAAVCPSFSLPS